MKNGIRDLSTGESHTLRDEEDLKDSAVQTMLEKNHHHSSLVCKCREHEGRFPALVPVRRHAQDKHLAVARVDIDEHTPGCYFARLGDETEKERRRASTILGPVRVRAPQVSAGAMTERSLRAQYDSYCGFARRAFSRGLADAYIRKNRGRHEHTNPTTDEVLRAVDSAITEMPFTDFPNGYDAALSQGATLRFGLVFGKVVSSMEPKPAITVHWWTNGTFSVGFAPVMAEAMAPAVADLRIFENFQAPPYLIIAVQNRSNQIQRIFLHQVAVTENYLFPADSGTEATYLTSLFNQGIPVIKPVELEDLERILVAFNVRQADGKKWDYRPDVVTLLRSETCLTLHIVELRGFKKGKNPGYDLLLIQKGEYYWGLQVSIPHDYEVVDGTSLVEWNSPSNGPEEWETAEVIFEVPSFGLFPGRASPS